MAAGGGLNKSAKHNCLHIDNNARFRYQVGYWFRLIDASICGAAGDSGTQFEIFDSSASKKELLIFKVWEDGQSEPGTWDLTGQEELTDPQNGLMLLISHRADASFGTVTISP